MRAFAADRHGPVSELSLRELPQPRPGKHQLLIRVHGAALNPADLKVLEHRDGGSFLHASSFPLILGFDFSGVIESIGEGVTKHAVGDEVYGFLPYARSTRGGTFAEYVVAGENAVGRKPRSISHSEAAAAATTAASALQALRKGRLAAGQSVLIHGASGGLGSYAVQIAKLLGASRVVGTASAAKLDYVRELGADHAVDYRAIPLAAMSDQFAVILDAASASSFAECAPLLESGGSYVATLPSPRLFAGMARALFSSKRCTFFIAKSEPADLDQLAAWFDAGTLKAAVERSYPLAELPVALERMRTGAARGKLAITVDS